jgi:hypothetical protein
MSIASRAIKTVVISCLAFCAGACEDEAGTAGAATSKRPEPPPPPAPVATTAPAPSAVAKPRDDCPEGSSGEGTFNKPCEAKGPARLMEVTWTGKIPDDGPSFRVINKSKLVILYGKIYVYFYDKAGKQLEVKDESVTPAKTRPYQTCAGNIFGGVMKVEEKAVITFSCVKKDHVPEGTAKIEGELQIVGFADADGKKVEFYWRNEDLAPKERPKGGLKK